MRSVQLREAKATLSALVDAAEKGEPTTITRHGKPAAVIVPASAIARMEKAREAKPDFVDMLMSIPEELPFVRDNSSARRVKF